MNKMMKLSQHQLSCIAWAMNSILNIGVYTATNVGSISRSQRLRALRAIIDVTDGTAFDKRFVKKTICAIEGGAQ